uniref:Proteasome subunit beta n=1 Tax=Stegastes partitus TaxID=144197 RepID=A0A3B5AEL8_9TELE
MALEDICSSKDRHHKWFPFSSLEDTDTSIYMMDYFNLRWSGLRTSEKYSSIPLHFFMPPSPNSAHLCLPNHSKTVRRPFPLSHGTTTLGFIFQGGVIAAADTRASAAGLVCCPAAHKINPIHSHLVVASSGSAADCMLWERILIREIRLYQLRHGRRLSIRGTAKLLSLMLHPFKGTEVLTDSASPNSGPKLVYVCSDGARLQGDIFSVGSGSPYAYGVLDGGLRWNLSKDEAFSLAREAVFRATHRDAYSGNNVDLFHITAQGWSQREREDLKEEYYRDMNYRKKMTCKL